MENTFEKADELTNNIRDYINTRISLLKLEVAEKLSLLIGKIIALIVVVFFLSVAWVFFNISLGFYLSDVLHSRMEGFLIVGGFNLFIACMFWLTKGKLIRIPVMNAIIKLLYPNDESN